MILEDVFVFCIEDLEDEVCSENGFLLDWAEAHFGAKDDCVFVVFLLVIFEPGEGLGGQYKPEFFGTT